MHSQRTLPERIDQTHPANGAVLNDLHVLPALIDAPLPMRCPESKQMNESPASERLMPRFDASETKTLLSELRNFQKEILEAENHCGRLRLSYHAAPKFRAWTLGISRGLWHVSTIKNDHARSAFKKGMPH